MVRPLLPSVGHTLLLPRMVSTQLSNPQCFGGAGLPFLLLVIILLCLNIFISILYLAKDYLLILT